MSLIVLNISVPNVQDMLSLYDNIQVWRSTSGIDGVYEEITNSIQTPALIDGDSAGPFLLNGTELIISLNGAPPKSVVFDEDYPLDLGSIIAKINGEIPDIASEVPSDTDRLRLSSPITGRSSSLLLSGNAIIPLGLTDELVVGLGSRIPLHPFTTHYVFRDINGGDNFFYKTRFSNISNFSSSEFSNPRQGRPGVVVPPSSLSRAYANLVDGSGNPAVNVSVRFYLQNTHSVIDTEYKAIPGYGSRILATTNERGEVSISLLKGARYRVTFEGMAYSRDFTVPNDDEFDLLELIGSSPDPFDIAQAPIRPIKVTL
jgi:hypothetical protein